MIAATLLRDKRDIGSSLSEFCVHFCADDVRRHAASKGKDTVDIARIRRRLERYVSTYYSELRSKIAPYPAAEDIFPGFLIGPKRVLAMLCTDGILVGHWPAEKDSFEFAVKQLSVSDAVREISGDGFAFEYPAGSAFDIQVAGVVIYRGSDGTRPVVWRTPWDRIEVSAKFGASRWGGAFAKSAAVNDVLTFVSAHLMQMRDAQPPDILNGLRMVIKEFEDLLSRTSREEDLQAFLSKHPVLLSPTALNVFPKHPLGSEYITDFVIHQGDGEYILVEVEAASHKLFTGKGDPTAKLSHAQQQVENWRDWVQENVAYAQNNLPGINDPDCWIVMGRDSSLGKKGRKALRRKNKELPHITIMTFDDLLKAAGNHLRNLSRLR